MKYLIKLSIYAVAVFLVHFIFVIWFFGQIQVVYNDNGDPMPFYYKSPPPDLTKVYTEEEIIQRKIKSKKDSEIFWAKRQKSSFWIEAKEQAIYFSWYPYFLLFLLMQSSLVSVIFFTLSIAVLSIFGFFLPFEIITISASILVAYLLKNIFNTYRKSDSKSITIKKKIILFLSLYILIKIFIHYYIDIFHIVERDRSLDVAQYSFTDENLEQREAFTTYLTNHAIEYEVEEYYNIIVNDRHSKDLRKVIIIDKKTQRLIMKK